MPIFFEGGSPFVSPRPIFKIPLFFFFFFLQPMERMALSVLFFFVCLFVSFVFLSRVSFFTSLQPPSNRTPATVGSAPSSGVTSFTEGSDDNSEPKKRAMPAGSWHRVRSPSIASFDDDQHHGRSPVSVDLRRTVTSTRGSASSSSPSVPLARVAGAGEGHQRAPSDSSAKDFGGFIEDEASAAAASPDASEESSTAPVVDAPQIFVWGCLQTDMHVNPVPLSISAIGSEANVRFVAAGADHFLVCSDAGLCYSWGRGGAGALGLGDMEDRSAPTFVEALNQHHVTHISAARNHSAAVTDRGVLFHWGTLGNVPGVEPSVFPQRKSEFKGILPDMVALGEGFVICLMRDGTCLSWGENSEGQLGCNSPVNWSVPPCTVYFDEKIIAVYAGRDIGCALSIKGTPYMWGASLFRGGKPARSPQRIPVKFKVEQMAVGSRHVILLSHEGRVYAMGDNSRSQLGLPNPDENRTAPTLVALEEDASSSGAGATVGSGGVGPGGASGGRASTLAVGSVPSASAVSSAGLNSPSASSKTGSKGLLSTFRVGKTSKSGAAEPTGPFIAAKFVDAGLFHTTVLTTNGRVFEWGQMVMQGEGKELRSPVKAAPSPIASLDGVSIEILSSGAATVLAVVGLKNSKDMKFLSFNPPIVKCASLEKLVEWLVRENRVPTDTFDYTFFLTLHTFTTPVAVLEQLEVQLSNVKGNSQAENRIIGIVYKWMRKRPKDFFAGGVGQVVDRLLSVSGDLRGALSKEIAKVNALKEKGVVPVVDAGPPPPSSLDLLSYDPITVAEQLTLIDSTFLAALDAREFLQNAWSKSDKDVRAPNILRFIGNFNRMSYYVTTHILLGASLEDRSQRLQFWGQVMKHCSALNNLSMSLIIVASIRSVPMNRLLKRELIEMKPATEAVLVDLEELMKNNRALYRRRVEAILANGEPGIPNLAFHLSDLTFLEDGNPSMTDGLINMQKRHLIGRAIAALEKLQARSYKMKRDVNLRAFLMSCEPFQEAALDHLSEKIISEAGTTPVSVVTPANDAARAAGANAADTPAFLESEAQKVGDARVQIWKDWYLRFCEKGADFLNPWRMSLAWELTLKGLLRHPPSKREADLFVELMSMMLTTSAPYLGPVVGVLGDIGRGSPNEALINKVVETLSCLKWSFLDASDAFAAATPSTDPVVQIRAQLNLLKQRTLSAKHWVIGPLPRHLVECAEAVKGGIEEHRGESRSKLALSEVDLEQLDAGKEQIEFHRSLVLELDQKLEVMTKREAELRRELEDLVKVIAETERSYREAAKTLQGEQSALGQRQRVAETGVADSRKAIEAWSAASVSWNAYLSGPHQSLVAAGEQSRVNARAWFPARFEEVLKVFTSLEGELRARMDAIQQSESKDAQAAAKNSLQQLKVEIVAFDQATRVFLNSVPGPILGSLVSLVDELTLQRDGVMKLLRGPDNGGEESRDGRSGSGGSGGSVRDPVMSRDPEELMRKYF